MIYVCICLHLYPYLSIQSNLSLIQSNLVYLFASVYSHLSISISKSMSLWKCWPALSLRSPNITICLVRYVLILNLSGFQCVLICFHLVHVFVHFFLIFVSIVFPICLFVCWFHADELRSRFPTKMAEINNRKTERPKLSSINYCVVFFLELQCSVRVWFRRGLQVYTSSNQAWQCMIPNGKTWKHTLKKSSEKNRVQNHEQISRLLPSFVSNNNLRTTSIDPFYLYISACVAESLQHMRTQKRSSPIDVADQLVVVSCGV